MVSYSYKNFPGNHTWELRPKKIKNKTFLVRNSVQINQLTLPPNQSLKLTEPAVNVFCTRETTRLQSDLTQPRGTGIPVAAAVRRRSLAPVR